jgi:crotonobetainyl-CoA:carnitine CoA-transferase CaiB-like acyl-CoA transferase
MITEVEHSKAGRLKVVNSPLKLSRTPVKIERACPELGEHTEEVLQNLLGFSQEKITELRSLQAI